MSIKRFNYALDSVWYANEAKYKSDYAKSIVFIHKSNGDGVAIYAHGSYFPTDVSLNNFNELVDSALSEGANITITPTKDAQGKITDIKIGAVSLSSLIGLANTDKTKLVEAQAVAGAFSDVNSELIYDPTTANADSYTFQQEFTNLKGEKISPKKPTVKITAGDNVTLDANANDGLVISATDTTYSISATSTETNKVNLNLSDNNETPIVDKVTFTGSGDATVSISGTSNNEVITINATPYIGKEAISIDSSLVENATSKEIKLVIDPTDLVLTQSDAGLKTNLELWYNGSGEKYNNQYDKDANGINFEANHVYLLGKNKDTVPYIVSEFDATSFVKDSFLSDVQYLVITGEEVEGEPGYGAGVEPGKYIAFYFTTIERDDQSNINDVYSQQVIYLNVKDFYTPVSVLGDEASYSVVDKSTGTDGSDIYTVKNTLGTISRDNATNTITVSKVGLTTVSDIKAVLETIDSDLDAVKPEGSNENEIAVVTGIEQVDGKITSIDSGLAATKTYVDDAISTAIQDLDAEVTSTDGTKVQVKVTEADGKITAVNVTETDIASAQDLADLTAEVEENEEVTAAALADLNEQIEEINETIAGLDLGVSSVKASTSSNHVTVAPTTDTKGAVTLNVDVASVDATDTTTYTATGLATDAYVDEKVATAVSGAEGSITLTNDAEGEYVFAEENAGYVTAEHIAEIMNEAWAWGTI